MGFIEAMLGISADAAVAQHGLGEAMHEASKANMRGRQQRTAHEAGESHIKGALDVPKAAASDAQGDFNGAAHMAGYTSLY